MLAPTLVLLSALLASPYTEEEPVRQVRVLGGFVDETGEPIADVEVSGRVAKDETFVARSDERGRIDVVAGWTADTRNPRCLLTARHTRFARWSHSESVRVGGELDFGTIVLEPGGTLSGLVRDADGRPLANAAARLVDATEHGPPAFERAPELPGYELFADGAASDDDGRFRIVGVPTGEWYVLVKHETTCCHAGEVVTLTAGDALELEPLTLAALPDEYRIEGVVLDAAGEPLPGALVSTSVPMPVRQATLAAKATSREDGTFRLYLPHLPERALDLRVEPAGDLHDDARVAGVRAGAREVVVRLGTLRELELLVLDDAGQPVEAYELTVVVDKPGHSIHTGLTPELLGGGRSRLRVPDHPLEIRVRTLEFDDEPTFVAAGPLDGSVTIRLKPLAAITGRLTYRGEPLADVPVELVCREPNYLHVVEGHWSGLYYGFGDKGFRTDAEGRFCIPNDFPHIVYYVRAWQPGFAPGRSTAVQVGDPPVAVELRDGGRLEGTVVLPGIGPRAGIGLELQQKKLRTWDSPMGRVFNAAADEEGRFHVDHLEAGSWLVAVAVPGRVADELGWDAQRRKECEELPFVVDIREGEVTRATFELGRELCRLEGRLTVDDLIREGYCNLLLEGPQALRVAFGGVDIEGRFRLAVREPGTYRLAIHAGPGHHQYKVVSDLVRLAPGKNEWVRDLAGEMWQGEGVRLDPD